MSGLVSCWNLWIFRILSIRIASVQISQLCAHKRLPLHNTLKVHMVSPAKNLFTRYGCLWPKPKGKAFFCQTSGTEVLQSSIIIWLIHAWIPDLSEACSSCFLASEVYQSGMSPHSIRMSPPCSNVVAACKDNSDNGACSGCISRFIRVWLIRTAKQNAVDF